MEYRTERDTMGPIEVPAHHYWGAQTERSRNNFKIGREASMPIEIVHAFAFEKAAARTNAELGVLDAQKSEWIGSVVMRSSRGNSMIEFPLVVWQTGSGTQSNMNVNEVIANRGHVIQGGALTDEKKLLHPNDDVNKSQSSNDTFPTAMHIATYKMVAETTIPGIQSLRDTLAAKAAEFDQGGQDRAHAFHGCHTTYRRTRIQRLCTATGQRNSGAEKCAGDGCRTGSGGTAVGTGLNTPQGYAQKVAGHIAKLTGLSFCVRTQQIRIFGRARCDGRNVRCTEAPGCFTHEDRQRHPDAQFQARAAESEN